MAFDTIFHLLLWLSFPFALATFITLMFVPAPYGRRERQGWGPSISNRLGWILMESPSAILFFLLFLVGNALKTQTAFVFLLMWEAHYVHRSFIYPLQIADGKKSIPAIVILMGVFLILVMLLSMGVICLSFQGDIPYHG